MFIEYYTFTVGIKMRMHIVFLLTYNNIYVCKHRVQQYMYACMHTHMCSCMHRCDIYACKGRGEGDIYGRHPFNYIYEEVMLITRVMSSWHWVPPKANIITRKTLIIFVNMLFKSMTENDSSSFSTTTTTTTMMQCIS